MEIGDYVTRKSYGNDMVFRIEHIIEKESGENIACLKGALWRLMADAPLSDLQPANSSCIAKLEQRKRALLARQIV